MVNNPTTELFPIRYFPSILVNDSIFMCGGISNQMTALSTSFLFDLQSLQYKQKKSMSNGRFKNALAFSGLSLIYSLGGYRGANAIRECLKYDIISDFKGYI